MFPIFNSIKLKINIFRNFYTSLTTRLYALCSEKNFDDRIIFFASTLVHRYILLFRSFIDNTFKKLFKLIETFAHCWNGRNVMKISNRFNLFGAKYIL